MYLLKYIINKPTPFKIIGGLTLVYSVIMFIYSLTLSGGESLIGIEYLILIGGAAMALGVDNLLTEKLKYKWVWYIEILIIALGFLFYWKSK